MAKIDKDGVRIIKSKISTPLESAAEELMKTKGAFEKVQPMFQLVFETIREIETKWQKED
tara:strand:+ start:353 stop:532 length:180 start_codon:yes stop_codon:yes gene_type:complete